MADKTAISAEDYKKLADSNAKMRAELATSKGKSKPKTGGSNRAKLTVIGNAKVNRSELKQLAEKGAALAASKERERERNSKENSQIKVFKDMAMKVTGFSAGISWLKNRTGAYNKLPEIVKGQPAAKDAAIALGLFYMAEKAETQSGKEMLMAAALSAAAEAGSTFGRNFAGADTVAQTINEKLGVQGPPLALAAGGKP